VWTPERHRCIDRLVSLVQNVDFILTESFAQPNPQIGIKPFEIPRALVEFQHRIVPNGNHLLLLGKFLDDSPYAAIRGSKLALGGHVIAFVDGPQNREGSERYCRESHEQDRQKNAAEKRQSRRISRQKFLQHVDTRTIPSASPCMNGRATKIEFTKI
jgi:hypothetical protein